MPHCSNHLCFGIGVEIRSQHHGVVRKTVNQDNGQQTVRATEAALHNGQSGCSLPPVINHFHFVFSLIFRAELFYRILFALHPHLSVQLKSDHIFLRILVQQEKNVIVIIASIHDENHVPKLVHTGADSLFCILKLSAGSVFRGLSRPNF